MAVVSGRGERILEAIVGLALWYGARAWGLVVGAVLVLAPLELAVVTSSLVAVPPALALVVGTVAAALFGLPPWTGESGVESGVAMAGVATSWLGWELLRESDAGIATLVLMLMVAGVALGVRTAVTRAGQRRPRLGA